MWTGSSCFPNKTVAVWAFVWADGYVLGIGCLHRRGTNGQAADFDRRNRVIC
jgi:hypothetical protein